jgi:hypothetical protein
MHVHRYIFLFFSILLLCAQAKTWTCCPRSRPRSPRFRHRGASPHGNALLEDRIGDADVDRIAGAKSQEAKGNGVSRHPERTSHPWSGTQRRRNVTRKKNVRKAPDAANTRRLQTLQRGKGTAEARRKLLRLRKCVGKVAGDAGTLSVGRSGSRGQGRLKMDAIQTRNGRLANTAASP